MRIVFKISLQPFPSLNFALMLDILVPPNLLQSFNFTLVLNILIRFGNSLENWSEGLRTARRGSGSVEEIYPWFADHAGYWTIIQCHIIGMCIEKKLQNASLNDPALKVRRINKLCTQ